MRTTPADEPVDNNFPRMVYRYPATTNDPSAGVTVQQLQDGSYDTAIAEHAKDLKGAAAEGWHLSTAEARDAHEAAVAAAAKKAEKAKD